MWRERYDQQHQYCGDSHACSLVRHNVLHEVRAQPGAYDRDDIHNHCGVDTDDTAHNDAVRVRIFGECDNRTREKAIEVIYSEFEV